MLVGIACMMLYLMAVDNVPTSSILSEVKQTHEAVKTLLHTSSKIDKQMDRMESVLTNGMSQEALSVISQYEKELPQ